MFAANLPVVTVNIPEPGWSLDLPLSATAVTTPVGRRFVAGHTVFTWKWIWKAAGLGRHTRQLNKNWEWSLQRDAGWEGVQSYCTGLSGSGRKHRRKRTKEILKYAPFDIERNVGRDAIRYVLCWLYPWQIQYSSLVMVKEPVLTAALHLSDKVTVYLSDHRRRKRTPGSQEMHWSDDTGDEQQLKALLELRLLQYEVKKWFSTHFKWGTLSIRFIHLSKALSLKMNKSAVYYISTFCSGKLLKRVDL